ncbi:Cilia- and flagella-associated protein 46 [Varanus komodoensis]|nr:Cilia- and flagella-associated protein 46 [Varanus komodoensis]
MRKASLDESQVGIKIARRNISNLRYADDTTLMAESEEELKSLLMHVKEKSTKVGLKLNIKKTMIMASGRLTSWQINGEEREVVTDFIFLGSKMVTAAKNLKDTCRSRQHTKKQRHHCADKNSYSQGYGFLSCNWVFKKQTIWKQDIKSKQYAKLAQFGVYTAETVLFLMHLLAEMQGKLIIAAHGDKYALTRGSEFFKHMVMLKARLGRNYIMEIQKFRDESEDYMSHMWHQLASVSSDLVGQLSCYQNTIEVLQISGSLAHLGQCGLQDNSPLILPLIGVGLCSHPLHDSELWKFSPVQVLCSMAKPKKESELKKVDNLLRFAEWLYCKQFPLNEAIKHLDWAISILLHLKPVQKSPDEEDSGNKITIGELRNIKQLVALLRAHTVMAVISGHGSPLHEQHCLMAYAFVIRIWQISLTSAGSVLKASVKISPTQLSTPKTKGKKDAKQPAGNSPTTPPKKDKSSKDIKQVQSVIKDKPKRKGPIEALPVNLEEWASYDCPDEIRDAFKQDSSGCAVNRETILAPTQTLYYIDLLVNELQTILCTHLTLPVLHLAEVIAQDVIESKTLSDLYHLRLSKVCLDLKLCQASSYHEKAVGEVYINEMEQGRFRQEIAVKNENALQNNHKEDKLFDCTKQDDVYQNKILLTAKDKILEMNAITQKELCGLTFPYLWIDKAEVLIQLCLYQPARLLLSEAHQATQEMNDPCAISRCLFLLAMVANLERKHVQAKALLEQAQLIGGNEHFWHNSTLCVTDAILGQDRQKNDKMACHFLQKTVNVLRPLLVERPNRESELVVIIACLEARKVYIQIDFAKDFINSTHHSTELPKMLLEPYEKLIHIEKDFLSYGYKDRSAEALMARANIHRMLGKHTTYAVDKQSHYLDAYRLAKESVSQMEQLFQHINNLLPVNEIRNINLPLMRILASMKLTLIEIILDIFVLTNTEKKKREAGAEQIEQIIEEFVRFTPDASSVEQVHVKCD